MAIKVDSLSRWRLSEPIIDNGKETFGLWTRPDFLKKDNVPENQIMLVRIDSLIAGRPDLIALKYYQNSLLEWVVVMFNRPLNPIGWPKIGTMIKIPSSVIVFSNI